jgi:putative ABC transport system permease protein
VTGGEVDALGLALSLSLVVLALGLSLARRLGLERGLIVASARALVQLLLVGLALRLVFDSNASIALSLLWVVAMVIFAAGVARRRAREVPGIGAIAALAFAATALIGMGLLFGLEIFPFEARTLVPMAGLAIGNSMNATILTARRMIEDVRDKRPEVEARLALGQTGTAATRPIVRDALRTALLPQIETTKAVGLVFLPGAMTGLILAGVEPLEAVLVQVVVMYLVLGSAAVSSVVTSIGVLRKLITRDQRLTHLPRPASSA